MALVLRRDLTCGESWLEAAIRAAKPYGLTQEIIDYYEKFIAEGDDESEAAFRACWEWDVLEFRPDEIGEAAQ